MLSNTRFVLLFISTAIFMLYVAPARGASVSKPPDTHIAVWGALPENARVTRTDTKEGIRYVELTENLPESLDTTRPFCQWLVWPIHNQKEAERFLHRSIHYITTVVTPDGTFLLGVKEGIKAKSSDGKHNGALAHFCFDPDKKGELKYPFPPLYKTAMEKGIVTNIQKGTLSSLNEMLTNRFVGLKNYWKDFTLATHIGYSRKRFLEALAGFYLMAPGMSHKTLKPNEFFNHEQRLKLRALSHQIRGACIFRLKKDKLHMLFKKCPLSQVVSEWNRIVSAKAKKGQKGALLAVSKDRQHEEIDGAVDLKVSSPEEAEKLALGLLLSIKGVSKGAP